MRHGSYNRDGCAISLTQLLCIHSGRAGRRADGREGGRAGGWAGGRSIERASGRAGGWVGGRAGGRVGWAGGRTDGRAGDLRADGRTDEREEAGGGGQTGWQAALHVCMHVGMHGSCCMLTQETSTRRGPWLSEKNSKPLFSIWDIDNLFCHASIICRLLLAGALWTAWAL